MAVAGDADTLRQTIKRCELIRPLAATRAQSTALLETQTATLDAKISVQQHPVRDLDRRLGQIDSAIEEAARRDKIAWRQWNVLSQ